MTIKVQGETYRDADELFATITELGERLEQLPEETPEWRNLQGHILRLIETLGEHADELSPESAQAALMLVPSESAVDVPPAEISQVESEDEPDEDAPGAPPDAKLCPICKGAGVLPIDPPIDPKTEMCPTCKGYGKTLTGSHVDGHELRDCPDCQGNGWINRRSTVTTNVTSRVAAAPGWPDAKWDAEREVWTPPPGTSPPWSNAKWDERDGTWT